MSALTYHNRRILDLGSFLDRFHKVTGGGTNAKGEIQYHAYCPAHETNHQSLAISVARDGRYLVKCYAGCSAAEVCAAVGLSLADLYPDGAMADRMRPIRPPEKVRIHEEVLKIAEETRRRGGKLSAADKAREREAWMALRKGKVAEAS